MAITAILAGLAAIGAILLIDQAERQKPALQPVRVKSNERKTAKTRS
ncbi:MAG: hypothetical protein H7318_03155 [Oligoflexus sp.]|nr:hypothetical protein [Oligoflexus sp.]